MTPEEYNKGKLESGDIGPEHISILSAFWQQNHDLEADGMCGAKTITSLLESLPKSESTIGALALEIAIGEIGNGEVGGNNSGPHIAKYKGIKDDGDDDDDGAWCASFVSWCCLEAAKRLEIDLPFKTSHGAKRLLRNVIKSGGGRISDPKPGDIVCWDRGRPGSWQGHIGFVENLKNGILYTVEGNVGRFPSRVRKFQHDFDRETRLEGFARL